MFSPNEKFKEDKRENYIKKRPKLKNQSLSDFSLALTTMVNNIKTKIYSSHLSQANPEELKVIQELDMQKLYALRKEIGNANEL